MRLKQGDWNRDFHCRCVGKKRISPMRLKQMKEQIPDVIHVCRKEENLTYEIETLGANVVAETTNWVGKKRISPMRLKLTLERTFKTLLICRKEENLTYEIETNKESRGCFYPSMSERRESHLWDWNFPAQERVLTEYDVGKKRISPMRLKPNLAVGSKQIPSSRKEENLTYEIETSINKGSEEARVLVGKKRISPMRLKRASQAPHPPYHIQSERRESHLWDWNNVRQPLVNNVVSVGKKRISPMRLKLKTPILLHLSTNKSERRESHLWDWNNHILPLTLECKYVGKKRISPMRLKHVY